LSYRYCHEPDALLSSRRSGRDHRASVGHLRVRRHAPTSRSSHASAVHRGSVAAHRSAAELAAQPWHGDTSPARRGRHSGSPASADNSGAVPSSRLHVSGSSQERQKSHVWAVPISGFDSPPDWRDDSHGPTVDRRLTGPAPVKRRRQSSFALLGSCGWCRETTSRRDSEPRRYPERTRTGARCGSRYVDKVSSRIPHLEVHAFEASRCATED